MIPVEAKRGEGGLVRFIGKLCELTTLHILFWLYNANYVIARVNEYYMKKEVEKWRNIRDNRLPQTSPQVTDVATWGDWEHNSNIF